MTPRAILWKALERIHAVLVIVVVTVTAIVIVRLDNTGAMVSRADKVFHAIILRGSFAPSGAIRVTKLHLELDAMHC